MAVKIYFVHVNGGRTNRLSALKIRRLQITENITAFLKCKDRLVGAIGCHHGTPLHFGGRILGDEAACVAKVTHAWPEVLSITVRLFADVGGVTWDRLIQIGKA